MTTVQTVFHFEDTVPVSYAVGRWNDTQTNLRAGAGPANVDAARADGNGLASAANALAVQYLELLSSHDKVEAERDAAQAEIDQLDGYLAEDDEFTQVHQLAQFVRWYHDRNHSTQHAWAVCAHEMCRLAGRFVS